MNLDILSLADKKLWASSSRQKNLLERFGIGEGRLIRSLKELDTLEQIDYDSIQIERNDWNTVKSLLEDSLQTG